MMSLDPIDFALIACTALTGLYFVGAWIMRDRGD